MPKLEIAFRRSGLNVTSQTSIPPGFCHIANITPFIAWHLISRRRFFQNDIFLYPVFLLVLFVAVQSIQIRSIPPGQKWPGFSFALHLLRVKGYCFAPLQYAHIQAFTVAFILFMQFIQSMPQNNVQSFTGAFPALCPILPPYISDRHKRL